MPFEFATATRIVFGEGMEGEVAPAAKSWGRRALLVTGRAQERAKSLRSALEAAGVACSGFVVEGEPTVELVERGVRQARREQCDVVIARGGGSAIDAGKAMAGLLTNPGEVLDYLEVVGAGKPLTQAAAPFIAIPTTAGTGSEVTRNAVLGVADRRVKVSLRSPFLLARLAVIDSELTIGMPAAVTARTGLDALTQLIEAYVSIRANPLTDGFCIEGIKCVARSLWRAFENGQDREARRDMSLAALLSGLALANAGLGVVHGIAGPLGGKFPAPHGAICAAVLPYGMEVNLRALRVRTPSSAALGRYEHVARLLTERGSASAEDGITWVCETCRALSIPPLHTYGMGEADIPVIVGDAMRASSTKGNPLPLTTVELEEVLEGAMTCAG